MTANAPTDPFGEENEQIATLLRVSEKAQAAIASLADASAFAKHLPHGFATLEQAWRKLRDEMAMIAWLQTPATVLDVVPYAHLAEASALIEQFGETCMRMQQYVESTVPNPLDREKILVKFREIYRSWMQRHSSYIQAHAHRMRLEYIDQALPTVTRTKAEILAQANREVARTLDSAGSLVRRMSATLVGKEAELNQVVELKESLEKDIAKNNVLIQFRGADAAAEFFVKQADEYSRESSRWFRASVVGAIIYALITAAAFGRFGMAQLEAEGLVPFLLTRAFVLLIASGILVYVLRNYAALRHLEALNRHRANALKTFEYFAAHSFEDKEMHAAFLRRATRVIFEQMETGFLGGKEKSPAEDVTLQVIKAALGKVGKGDE